MAEKINMGKCGNDDARCQIQYEYKVMLFVIIKKFILATSAATARPAVNTQSLAMAQFQPKLLYFLTAFTI